MRLRVDLPEQVFFLQPRDKLGVKFQRLKPPLGLRSLGAKQRRGECDERYRGDCHGSPLGTVEVIRHTPEDQAGGGGDEGDHQNTPWDQLVRLAPVVIPPRLPQDLIGRIGGQVVERAHSLRVARQRFAVALHRCDADREQDPEGEPRGDEVA